VTNLLDQVVVMLTGLPLERLRVLGYVVRDSGTHKEVLHVGPLEDVHPGPSVAVGAGTNGGNCDQAPRNS
jgi:hypothetical protein